MTNMRSWLRAARKSTVTYPVVLFWVVSAAACMGVAEHWVTWPLAVIILLAFAVFLVACSILHQVTQVRRLVNGQRDELVQEVRVLRRALDNAGVRPPLHVGARRENQ